MGKRVLSDWIILPILEILEIHPNEKYLFANQFLHVILQFIRTD